MLIKWSAPLFVKLKLTSFGLSFGRQTTATFAVATSTEAQRSLASPAGHIISGLEWSLTCGATLRERADVISSNFAADINTVGVSKVSGSLFDLSFTGAPPPPAARCHPSSPPCPRGLRAHAHSYIAQRCSWGAGG
jgi:lipid-binding SYLF domain-containing protein